LIGSAWALPAVADENRVLNTYDIDSQELLKLVTEQGYDVITASYSKKGTYGKELDKYTDEKIYDGLRHVVLSSRGDTSNYEKVCRVLGHNTVKMVSFLC
jgi:hypothetical protein